ncbi:MAG TPA: hypothetical protein VL728_19190 [Cyclobacteriaceae bacterium]|nr:hypothetical protein [Cyclobacteriaceae bacterium]
MRKFLTQSGLFVALPLGFLLLLAYLDPFNFFRVEKDADHLMLKKQIGTNINSRLYKLIEYGKSPTEVVILGDSRTDQLKTAYFEKLLNKRVTNLSYGGGSLPEIISTFDEVVKSKKVTQIYIGVSFNLYNKKNEINLVPEAVGLKQSLISYLVSKYCLRASLLYGKALLFHESLELGKPPYTKEEFWDYQLYSSAANFYRAYAYPGEWFQELKRISGYCATHNIKLTFLVPPTHVDLQKRIADFHLLEEEEAFKKDLTSLGAMYDFDYSNDITLKRGNFLDPFHSVDSVSRLVVTELVTGETKYSKFSTPIKN